MLGTVRLRIEAEIDVMTARLRGSEMAVKLGFSPPEVQSIAMAISEVARNIVVHAGHGSLTLAETADGGLRGLSVVAKDASPGIADIDRAMQPGYTTGRGLGLGLPGAAAAMDEFEIVSAPGRGTTVRMTKWKFEPEAGCVKAGKRLVPAVPRGRKNNEKP